jgi:sulfite exporter TauE/SafE
VTVVDPGPAAFLAVGLLGGAHCLGMCGPLVTTYADRLDAAGDGGARRGGPAVGPFGTGAAGQQTLFNLGRTLSYAVVGGVMGALGGVLIDAATLAAVGTPVRVVVGLLAGTVVLAVGVGYLTGGRNGVLARVGHPPLVGAAFARVHGALGDRLDALATGPGVVLLGAVHGLLPCPLLYPAYLYAVASGSALVGALSLAALGAGTVPTVLGYGLAFGSLSEATRGRLHRVLGVVFVVLGTVPLTRVLAVLGVAVPALPLPMPPLPAVEVAP